MERAPHPALAGLVRSVWLSTPAAPQGQPANRREWMMPSGEMHLVLRLAGPPIGVFEHPDKPAPEDFGYAVVNGARAGVYAKSFAAGASSIGLQLLPGAAQALLGLPADELAGRHVRLADIWGADASLLHEQLLAAPSAAGKLACLEGALIKRLAASPRPSSPSAHAAVLAGLGQLQAGCSVDAAARHSGYSQRQFVRLFSAAIGLTPRLYTRVQRFQRALRLLQGVSLQKSSLADVAAEAGYTDQPHFNRDFREFSGLTPELYRAARPAAVNHVPMAFPARGNVGFIQDRRSQAA
jgi:AraC-like DNA-binding protein